MASKTDIYNRACRHAKLGRVSSPDEGTPQAVALTDVYSSVLDSLLSEAFWNFAKQTADLQIDGDAPANSRWSKIYSLPSDSVEVFRLNGLRNETQHAKWEIEGRNLFTDESSASIEYTRRETNTGRFSGLFTEVLELALALAAFAADLSDNRVVLLENKYERVLLRAKTVDALEGSPRPFKTSVLIRARQGILQDGNFDDPRFV